MTSPDPATGDDTVRHLAEDVGLSEDELADQADVDEEDAGGPNLGTFFGGGG